MSALALIVPRLMAMAEVEPAPLTRTLWKTQSDDVLPPRKGPRRLRSIGCSAAGTAARTQLERHPQRAQPAAERRLEPAPQMAFYRKYTEAMLRRYQVLSMESGRVPSLLGREMFRGKVTSYRVHGFDDVVIFCHDVGQCLEQLDLGQRLMLRKIAIEEHTQAETAAMAGLSLRTVVRRYAEALDRLTAVFLKRNLLEPLGE